MRGKLPHDYTTQGSTFKAKKRDGDQTDIKGFRATVPAEEFMPEQQRAVAAAFPARLHLCPRPPPAASAQVRGKPPDGRRCPRSWCQACLRRACPLRGLVGTPCPAGGTTGQIPALRPLFPEWPPRWGDEAVPTPYVMQFICKWGGEYAQMSCRYVAPVDSTVQNLVSIRSVHRWGFCRLKKPRCDCF